MIFVWTSNKRIKAIYRSGQVKFIDLEEVERITQSKYSQLQNSRNLTTFHFERLKSQIDHLQMFMKRKLTRVALCV